MLDQAFDTLMTYDAGSDPNALKPIDEAIVASAGDAAARSELESRLANLLSSDISRLAKDVVCRKLMQIGTAASVPALAKCLTDAEQSHMARYALEQIDSAEASKALRDALGSTKAAQKVGVITSLGAKQDAESVEPLSKLLEDTDPAIARSTAVSLGQIGSSEAADALATAKPTNPNVQVAVTDGLLACAEHSLADGDKARAMKIYQGLLRSAPAKHVRLAVTRGMLASAGKASGR